MREDAVLGRELAVYRFSLRELVAPVSYIAAVAAAPAAFVLVLDGRPPAEILSRVLTASLSAAAFSAAILATISLFFTLRVFEGGLRCPNPHGRSVDLSWGSFAEVAQIGIPGARYLKASSSELPPNEAIFIPRWVARNPEFQRLVLVHGGPDHPLRVA